MQAYRLKERVEVTHRLTWEPGTIVFDYIGSTFGCCKPEEVPISKEPHEGPFVGVSRGSLEPVGHFHPPTAVRRLEKLLGPTGRLPSPPPEMQNIPYVKYRNFLFLVWLRNLCEKMHVEQHLVDPEKLLQHACNVIGHVIELAETKSGQTIVRVPEPYCDDFERAVINYLENI